MRAIVKSSAFHMSVLSLASLLALASPIVAATNPEVRGTDMLFPRGFDAFYDKIQYSTKGAASTALQEVAGPAEELSRLAVRLYGGFSYMAAGDINAGCDGYFELVELYAAAGATSTGGYSPLHAGYNFGADLIFQLSPNIGVGVGAGYLRSSKNSLATLTLELDEITLTAAPTVSAIPIKLGLFLTLPIAEKINLTADVGGAYYAGLKFDAWQRVTFADNSWNKNAVSASKSGNLGFQGSLGFEYKLSSQMGLFVEAVGRYARFKNFETAMGTYENSDGISDPTEGKIYLVGISSGTLGEFDWIMVSETPPVVGDEIISVREPKFDLSGFSLQAGIRVRF